MEDDIRGNKRNHESTGMLIIKSHSNFFDEKDFRLAVATEYLHVASSNEMVSFYLANALIKMMIFTKEFVSICTKIELNFLKKKILKSKNFHSLKIIKIQI